MICYAMLCCAMLCYAMLCCAVLCYAMLCYAMLRCTEHIIYITRIIVTPRPPRQLYGEESSPPLWRPLVVAFVRRSAIQILVSLVKAIQMYPRVLYLHILDPMRSSSFLLWCPWIRDISYREPLREQRGENRPLPSWPSVAHVGYSIAATLINNTYT